MPAWLASFFALPLLSPVGIFAFYKILFLYRNRLIFKRDRLILPGPFGKSCLYENIKRIGLERRGIFLKIEIEDASKSKANCKIAIAGLNKESAAALWTQLATKTKNAAIDGAVRESLINWQDTATTVSLAADQKSFSQANLDAANLEALTLNFDERGRYSQLTGYLHTCGKVALHCWTGVWLVLLVQAILWFIVSNNSNYFLSLILNRSILHYFETTEAPAIQLFVLVFAPLGRLTLFAGTHLNNIWASYALGAIASGLFAYMVLKEREANKIVFNEGTMTLLRETPLGKTVLRSVELSKITAVRMRVPQSISGKLAKAALEISICESPTQSIKIPVGAFASIDKRKQFLELLNSLNKNVEIDELVLERLTPRAEDSYTNLWLNAIQAAPQLNQLLPLKPGDHIGHNNLTIEKQFSSGGQAVTYLAYKNSETQSKVILKEFLLPLFVESARTKTIERFNRDAKLLKNLDHPQIVILHDYFIEESRAFLMLEYIEGLSLKEKVEKEGKLGERAAINLAKQMTSILAYLHKCSPPVVHRDFTPENLILSEGELLKLIDFDVALEADQLNQQNNSAGKTHYLPPEQFRGQACPQSDIYALGATLFFLTTARNPEPMQVNRPSDVGVEITNSFDQFIAKCTEPDLERRYQSASNLANSLSQISSELEAKI
ncbi:hypothetical protein BH11CYA1_BH11CYA1_23010 [soil metagenome]